MKYHEILSHLNAVEELLDPSDQNANRHLQGLKKHCKKTYIKEL